MEIKAKIDRMVDSKSIKAIASASLDGMFVIKNLRVVDGSKGMFVACPQETYTDRNGEKKYNNIFFPISNAAKADLQDAVLDAYRQKLSQTPDRQPDFAPIEDDDDMLPFGISF